MLAAALCLVVAIADGDTLTVRCGESGAYQQVKVRLAEIDAPERGQPYGKRSRESLAALCHRQAAAIQPTGQDRYGRTLAHVQCAGIDAQLHQVTTGMAWHYVKYSDSPQMAAAQAQAVATSQGLWAEPSPQTPWAWRAKKKESQYLAH
jgi:endonuclease YncB( thermonuclease family)